MTQLNNLTNNQLFRLYVEEGSREAINLYFKNQMDLFYRVAFKYTKNNADAEDVLQAAFLSIMDTAYQFKGLNTEEDKLLQSWCLSVVVHIALMKLRSDSNRKKREYGYSEANSKLFYEDKTMNNENENQVINQKVQNAILQLPEKYRIPIHLKYIEGFELETISSILKLNSNTLRSQIKRGLEKISLQLQDEDVTLSSVGLIALIQKIPIEKAPFSYEAIASKMVNPTDSVRLLQSKIGAKTTTGVVKVLTAFSFVCFAIVVVYVGYHQLSEKEVLKSNSISQDTNSSETNQTWNFAKSQDRNIPILIGNWLWDDSKKYMIPGTSKAFAFKLPIKPQAKAFLVEIDCMYFSPININEPRICFLRPGWLHGLQFLGVENKASLGGKFHFNADKPITIKVYVYQNYICTFMPDNSYNVDQYKTDFKDADWAVVSKGILFKKITSKTLSELPKDLLKAINSKEFESETKTEAWLLNENFDLESAFNSKP